MRISKYGGRQYQGGNSGSTARTALFRRRYKVGQTLQGTLIKWERQKLGWVQIDDQRLLANITTSPSPGDMLTFVVQQLYPDIILKEITQDQLNEHGIYLNPVDITRQFVSRRAAFQSQASQIFRELKQQPSKDATQRLKDFLYYLENDTKSSVMFFETLKCVADLNSIFKSAKLFYMPWLVPEALNEEIVLKARKDSESPDNSFYELLFALDLPQSVPARFRIMYKKPQCGFKLLMDDQRLSALLSDEFKKSLPQFIGVERIPVQNSGGFLSELLGAS